MKKVVVSLVKVVVSLVIVLMFVFLAGCIDYKAYNANTAQNKEDVDLLNEIAQIEEELNLAEAAEENAEEVQEVAAPDLEAADLEAEDVQIITVDENELVKLNVKASDPDQDAVTYSFTRPLNAQGEWKTNYGDAGEYLATLKAADGVHTTEKKIKIIVNRVNVPPVIGLVKDIKVKEGETVKFEPEVSDPNKDPVTVTLSEPLKNGAWATDHTSAGEYLIKVVASDGEMEAEKTFKLMVENVNQLPVLDNLADVVVKEGETVTIEPEVTDLDEDKVTLTISEPVGDDGVWETTYTDHGEYFVTVTANDGKNTVVKKVKVTVEDVNMPPEFVEVSLAVN